MAEVAAGNIGGAILATLTLSAEFAIANAIACEASLVASFFESPTPTSGSNLCKKRWFNHYTTERGFTGIVGTGRIERSQDGYVYLTTDFYFTGTLAKSRLAMKHLPVGFFRIPEIDVTDVTRRGLVKPANDEKGGAEEWVSQEEVPISHSVWMPIF